MEKIGLVLEGGGVRGAYTAGALAWLSDNGIAFDYGVGISSGAVYLCCYEMNNRQIPYNMSVHYASEPETVGLKALMKEGYYVAYRRIFEEDLKGKEGMTLQPLIDKNPNIEIGAYVLEHGRTEYFGPKEMDAGMELLLGSCALPVASAVIEYNGMHLLDGGITKMIPIERAQEQGCTKFLVITTKPADYVRKPSSKLIRFVMRHIYKEYPQVEKDYAVRHLNYYKQIGIVKDLVAEGKAIHVLPSQNIKVSRFKGDEENCQKLYDLGYTDMQARKDEILAFIKK